MILGSSNGIRALGLIAFGLVCVASCAEDATGPGKQDETAAPSTLRVSADTVTFRWIGEKVSVGATVLDQRGVELAGQSLRWHATDSTLVTVDAEGMATARRVGSLLLIVELGRLADSIVVRVTQVPASLEVAPGSVA